MTILWRMLRRKLALLVLLASAIGAYATLGDGKIRSSKKSLLTDKTTSTKGSFSLRSGYSFRGSQVINTQSQQRYVNLNTAVTYQKGHTTFTVPLKKKVLDNKVTFNPNSSTRN